MKNDKFHIYLDDDEYRQVVQCLISLKNALIEQGRYTDAVDEVLIKFTKARKKKIAVQYISLSERIKLSHILTAISPNSIYLRKTHHSKAQEVCPMM